VRESLFARLGNLEGERVLDLYAGTGAMGIEALSRGAASVIFVERAPRCLTALRENLEALDLEGATRVVADDAVRAARRLGRAGERFDLVLVDPPYASGEAGRALEALVDSGALSERAMVVVERGRHHPLPAVAGLEALDERRYGDTVIVRLSAAPGGGRQGGSGGA